jgi:hypothetical protein
LHFVIIVSTWPVMDVITVIDMLVQYTANKNPQNDLWNDPEQPRMSWAIQVILGCNICSIFV